jgi:hypothetical protein
VGLQVVVDVAGSGHPRGLGGGYGTTTAKRPASGSFLQPSSFLGRRKGEPGERDFYRAFESEESQVHQQPELPKSDKKHKVKMSSLCSINLSHHAVMAY